MIVTINDVRAAGLCVRGAREWSERHGFDFQDFIRNGIEADRLLASGDALSQRVIEKKRERENG